MGVKTRMDQKLLLPRNNSREGISVRSLSARVKGSSTEQDYSPPLRRVCSAKASQKRCNSERVYKTRKTARPVQRQSMFDFRSNLAIIFTRVVDIKNTLKSKKEEFNFEQQKQKLQEFLAHRIDSIRNSKIFESTKIFNSTIETIFKREIENRKQEEDDGDQEKIPRFLEKLFRTIEQEKSIVREGLYRQNGNMADIQKLRFAIEENNLDKIDAVNSVHELTGVVKLFFRELREPLIPWNVIMLIKKELENVDENEEKRHHTKQVIKGFLSITFINKYNRKILIALMSHLETIMERSQVNKVLPSNLAVVIGPSLSWWPSGSVKKKDIPENMNVLITVMKYILTNLKSVDL